MRTAITIPQLGLIEEVVLLEWLKATGDSVEKGEPVVVIETEKVETEIEAPARGRLEIHLEAQDDAIPVGTLIGYVIGEGGGIAT